MWTPCAPGEVSCIDIDRCPHFRSKFLCRKHIWVTGKVPSNLSNPCMVSLWIFQELVYFLSAIVVSAWDVAVGVRSMEWHVCGVPNLLQDLWQCVWQETQGNRGLLEILLTFINSAHFYRKVKPGFLKMNLQLLVQWLALSLNDCLPSSSHHC